MVGRNSAETVHTVKTPKHIIEIGMTPDEYFDLKVHIKPMIAPPGMPGFGGKRFNGKENEKAYRHWLHNVLLQLGPKFFPSGGKGLVWPDDYDIIYKAVNQVIRTLSYKTRKEHGKKVEGVRAVEGGAGSDRIEVEMAEDGEHCGGGLAGDTEIDEDTVMPAEEILQRQKEEKEMMVAGQHGKEKEVTQEEEMRAAAIELEDLLDLMKPEAFAQLPDLTDEDFDWDGVADFSFQC